MVRRAGVSTNYWMGANNYGQPIDSKIFNWIDRKPWNYQNWAPGNLKTVFILILAHVLLCIVQPLPLKPEISKMGFDLESIDL